jgi:hypothetical protein
MTPFLEKRKKDCYCTTPHFSKQQTVKVKNAEIKLHPKKFNYVFGLALCYKNLSQIISGGSIIFYSKSVQL